MNCCWPNDSHRQLWLFPQEIYKDRKKFSRQVFEVASSDLVNMGITVVSYTLKDVRDEMASSYFTYYFATATNVWLLFIVDLSIVAFVFNWLMDVDWMAMSIRSENL